MATALPRLSGVASLDPRIANRTSEWSITPSSDLAERSAARSLGRPTPYAVWAAAGLTLLAAPTVGLIARASWTDEQSQQGPLVLAIGAWLLWRRWGEMRAAGGVGSPIVALGGFTASGLVYVAGRIASLFLVEAYALYAFGVCAVYALVGWRGLAKGSAPLVFTAFALPVPFFVSWPVTTHLRLWISETAVDLLRLFGITAAREGLTLYVGSYRVEIAQACSGMNSLSALTALGICFVHLRRDAGFLYHVVLLPAVLVFAVAANLARVLAVTLALLNLGATAAEGALHQVLGFLSFGVALGLTLLADAGLARFWPAPPRRGRP